MLHSSAYNEHLWLIHDLGGNSSSASSGLCLRKHLSSSTWLRVCKCVYAYAHMTVCLRG